MYPIVKVVMPASLSGKNNGMLPAELLVDIAPNGKLHVLAARAWEAMRHAAARDGISLYPTSTADTYRSYEQQMNLFKRRYTPTYDPNVNTLEDSRTFNGQTWYKLKGVAAAASPGKSNHGWGLAVDVSNSSGSRLAWMVANATRFGFSWEMASEPWHLRYVVAENIPAAVLEYEAQRGTPLPAPRPKNQYPGTPLRRGSKGDNVRRIQQRVGALIDGDFGPKTETAVSNWQRANGLKADGVVGPITWAAMFPG